MTLHNTLTRMLCDNVTPIGIYCYFASDCCLKIAKFRIVKHKASINAIQYVESTAKQGHIPSSVDSTAKVAQLS